MWLLLPLLPVATTTKPACANCCTRHGSSFAIELGFKAYLNHRGFALERLKDEFGHDLAKLQQAALAEARDRLLAQIVNAVDQTFDLLNDPYMDKRFIYRKIGWERYPKEQARVCGWIKAYLAEIKLLMDLPVRGDGLDAEGIQPLSPPTSTVTSAASAVAPGPSRRRLRTRPAAASNRE